MFRYEDFEGKVRKGKSRKPSILFTRDFLIGVKGYKRV